MASFFLKNTLSDNGGVTRDVCNVENGHTYVVYVIETSNIVKTENGAEADGKTLNPESYVSMNFWGFPAKENYAPEFLRVLEEKFEEFFRETVPANP